MAEQQLTDYIKKAQVAGQSDAQTRDLLYKNGWTVAEVDDAFASLSENTVAPTQILPEHPQTDLQPEPEPEPVNDPKIEVKTQPTMGAQDNMPRIKTKSHLFLKIFFALVIVVVLSAVGLYAAGMYINLPWNPFWPNPESVISKMISNMGNIKAYHSVSSMGIVLKSNESGTIKGRVDFSSDSQIDKTDSKNIKEIANFTLKLSVPALLSNGSSAPDITFGLNAVLVNNELYLSLTDINIPEAYSMYSGALSQLSQFEGKWIKIDQGSLNAIAQSQGHKLSSSSGVFQDSNSDLQKKIQNLISLENLLTVDKQLADQKINGQNTYHYSVKITKDKLKDLINKLIILEVQEVAKMQNSQPENNSDAVIGAVASSIKDSAIDFIGDTGIELWVDKKDYMLYQYKLDKIIDLSKTPLSSFISDIDISLNGTNSDFGKQISVQPPSDSQNIEDILLPFIEKEQVKSDINQISFIAQMLSDANKSYYSLCTKGLLNGYLKDYGQTLIDLNNDIVNSGAHKPKCYAGVQDYCVSAQLQDGSYVCIDKYGIIGSTGCVSYKTVCK